MTRYPIITKIIAFFNRCGIRISAYPKQTGASPRGGLEGAALEGACLLGLLLLFSCSSDDDGGGRTSQPERQTVRLYLNIPSTVTRAGDPGQSTEEDAVWDEFAVMIEYPETENAGANIPNEDRHIVQYISKSEYDALVQRDGYYWLPLDLLPGTVRFYGAVYCAKEGAELKSAINRIADSGNTSDTFADLEISNDYATADGTMDVAKFLSVATGYYNENNSRDFLVEEKTEWSDDDMPRMTLTRLAAKIDIQWDAADAYPAYTGVKVDNFRFYGDKDKQTEDITSSGSGRLFPDLCTDADGKILGDKSFLSAFTSPISQRNGRVYHYVFPDGVSTPKIVFSLSSDQTSQGNYTFNFTGGALKKAAWYKINTTISGLSKINTSQDITFSDGSTQSTDTGE